MKTNALSGSALVIAVVAVLVVGLGSFAVWRWWSSAQPDSQTPPNPSGLSAGDDNTSLDADLATINKSVNQESASTDASTMANDILQTNRKLSALVNKIQSRIADAKKAGKNTGSLQTQLDTMNETLTEANITANSVKSKTASDNTAANYRAQLQSAHQQNVAAAAGARTIVDALKELK